MLVKDEGCKSMVKISIILSEDQESLEGLSEDFKLNDLVNFKYATISSVDVKRSFSINKS